MDITTNIKEQNAECINNFYNCDVHINSKEKVDEILNVEDTKKKKIAALDYKSFLKNKHSTFNLIERKNVVSQISNLLSLNNFIHIFGVPGVGKSCILLQLFKNVDIYVSIQEKSIIKIFEYIINFILNRNGEELCNINNAEEGLQILESLLIKNELAIFFDDCDTNETFIKVVSTISLFKNKLIFVSREKNLPFKTPHVIQYEINPFSDEEIERFLSVNNITKTEPELLQIKAKSKGNPLYLYYVCKFQILPIPPDITSYNKFIWESFDSKLQFILSIISISTTTISNEILYEIFKSEYDNINFPQFNEIIIKGFSVLCCDNYCYEIFHPFFREFIINFLRETGTLQFYKKILGKLLLAKNNIIEGVELLYSIDFELIQDYIYSVFPIYQIAGEINLAIELLTLKEKNIQINNYLEIGYINYHLANLYERKEEYLIAKNAINKAVENFKRIDNCIFLTSATVVQMLFNGEPLDDIYAYISMHQTNEHAKAADLITLSKSYINSHKPDMAIKCTKESFLIAQKLNDHVAAKISLLNILAALNNTNIEIQKKYAEPLLEIIDPVKEKSFALLLFNYLTSIYRELKEWEKAIFYGEKAVQLSIETGLKAKELMNLVNLANVYRDNFKIQKAFKIYKETIKESLKFRYIDTIVRATVLLVEIIYGRNKFNFSRKILLLVQDVVGLNRDLQWNFRYYTLLGDTYENLNKFKLAEQQFFIASKLNFNENTFLAIYKSVKCNTKYNTNDINAIITYYDLYFNLLKTHADDGYFFESISLIDYDIVNDILLPKLATMFSECVVDQFALVNDFIEYCNKNNHKVLYNNLIDILIKKANYNCVKYIAYLIERSGMLIDLDQSVCLLESITLIDGMYYRKADYDSQYILTIGNANYMLQFIGILDELITIKIAISLSLFLRFYNEIFQNLENFNYVYTNETINLLVYSGEHLSPEQNKDILSWFENYKIPIIFFEKKEKRLPLFTIINSGYYSKEFEIPGNPILFRILAFLYNRLAIIFSNNSELMNSTNRKIILDYLTNIFNLRNLKSSSIVEFKIEGYDEFITDTFTLRRH